MMDTLGMVTMSKSRQLLVMRHAKSAWGTDAPSDFERPLSGRGIDNAPRMGQWLREQGLVPQWVVSSPAKRAEQTVVAVCQQLGIDEQAVQWEPEIYGASVDQLCEVLAGCPDEVATALVVGHNPGLEMLVAYLCPSMPVPPDGKLLPTAAVAQLRMPDTWNDLSEASAELVSITRPRSLDPR